MSLSEILNPTLLISVGPAMSWQLVQGVHALLKDLREKNLINEELKDRLECFSGKIEILIGLCLLNFRYSGRPLGKEGP